MELPLTPTIIKTDNSTTAGFVNKNVILKRSKAWDMNVQWMRDREKRRQFLLQWHAGKGNCADYFTRNYFFNQKTQGQKTYLCNRLNTQLYRKKIFYIL